jgi:hypothetical protein
MSSAILEILDKDLNVIGFGEYNGTSDSVPPEFVIDYETEMAGKKAYFLGGWDLPKNCKHATKDVTLFSNYGGGFYWPSKVCMECRCITGTLSPYEPDYGYSIQPKDEKKFWAGFRAEGYPRKGDPREGDKSSV